MFLPESLYALRIYSSVVGPSPVTISLLGILPGSDLPLASDSVAAWTRDPTPTSAPRIGFRGTVRHRLLVAAVRSSGHVPSSLEFGANWKGTLLILSFRSLSPVMKLGL